MSEDTSKFLFFVMVAVVFWSFVGLGIHQLIK